MNNSLGEKIKYYRQRSKKSQLELELETGLSTGTISRIENNAINPTKETLSRIADVLKLKPSELAYLLGINILSTQELVDAIGKIALSVDLETTLQTAVDIMFDLFPNYNGGLLFLRDSKNKNLLWVKVVSNLPRIKLALNLLRKRIDEHFFNLETNKDSLIVKTFLTGSIIQGDSLVKFGKGAEIDSIIHGIEVVLGYKWGISIPLVYQDEIIGVSFFTKRVKETLSDEEVKLLKLLSDQMAILIKKAERIDELQGSLNKYLKSNG